MLARRVADQRSGGRGTVEPGTGGGATGDPESVPTAAEVALESDIRLAADGDHRAWERIHDRYAALIWSIARAYRLEDADAADVCQTTWLRLAENLDRIRKPAQVRFWLSTTARREAMRAQRRAQRVTPIDPVLDPWIDTCSPLVDDRLVDQEEWGAVRKAFFALPVGCQELLRVLMSEPAPSYAEVSDVLSMPIGSIGPRRARCLDRLRVASEIDLDDGRPAA